MARCLRLLTQQSGKSTIVVELWKQFWKQHLSVPAFSYDFDTLLWVAVYPFSSCQFHSVWNLWFGRKRGNFGAWTVRHLATNFFSRVIAAEESDVSFQSDFSPRILNNWSDTCEWSHLRDGTRMISPSNIRQSNCRSWIWRRWPRCYSAGADVVGTLADSDGN